MQGVGAVGARIRPSEPRQFSSDRTEWAPGCGRPYVATSRARPPPPCAEVCQVWIATQVDCGDHRSQRDRKDPRASGTGERRAGSHAGATTAPAGTGVLKGRVQVAQGGGRGEVCPHPGREGKSRPLNRPRSPRAGRGRPELPPSGGEGGRITCWLKPVPAPGDPLNHLSSGRALSGGDHAQTLQPGNYCKH